MKKLLAFVSTLALVLLLFFLWMGRLWPFSGLPDPEPATVEALRVEMDAARVTGTAHYPMRLSIVRPGRFGAEDTIWWVFPLFPEGDTHSRIIRALVVSPNEPERLVGFENMTIEGWVRPPPALVTPDIEGAFREENYSFGEDYVLFEMFPPAAPS